MTVMALRATLPDDASRVALADNAELSTFTVQNGLNSAVDGLREAVHEPRGAPQGSTDAFSDLRDAARRPRGTADEWCDTANGSDDAVEHGRVYRVSASRCRRELPRRSALGGPCDAVVSPDGSRAVRPR